MEIQARGTHDECGQIRLAIAEPREAAANPGGVLVPAAESFQIAVRQPNSEDDQSRRSIEEIPPEEVALAMRNLVRDSVSIERDKLLLLTAGLFGFERAGNHIQNTLANIFDDLVETGQLILLEDRVSLPN